VANSITDTAVYAVTHTRCSSISAKLRSDLVFWGVLQSRRVFERS